MANVINNSDAPRPAPIRLRVLGMFCGRCALRVERALRCVRGVADARVNRVAGMVTVSLPTGAIETAALIAAVRAAGYDAEPIHTDALDDARALEQMFLERLRQERQAIIVAVGLTAPVVALAYLGPALQSGRPGAAVWWVTLQGMLAFMLLLSPAGAPLLVAGLRAILHGFFHPDLLSGLAVVAAFSTGVREATTGHPHAEGFVTAAMILTVINSGRNLETRLRRALVRTAGADIGPGATAASALRNTLADDLASALVPISIAIAALTFLAWMNYSAGAWWSGMRAAIAVLVIASPSALGLAPSPIASTARPSMPFRTASVSERSQARAHRLMHRNLWLTIAYHLIAIAAAALGQVPPICAAAAAALWPSIIALNVLRLRRHQREG